MSGRSCLARQACDLLTKTTCILVCLGVSPAAIIHMHFGIDLTCILVSHPPLSTCILVYKPLRTFRDPIRLPSLSERNLPFLSPDKKQEQLRYSLLKIMFYLKQTPMLKPASLIKIGIQTPSISD
jgi:hypothetical protein